MKPLQPLSGIKNATKSIFLKFAFWRSHKEKSPAQALQDAATEHEQRAVLRVSGKRIPHIKQLRYGWRIFSTREQRIVISALALFFITIVTFAGVYSYNRTALLPAVGGTYIEGLLQAPQFLNPILAFDNDTDVSMNRLLFAGLLKYDKNLELIPDLAESYTVNEEQTIYTFVLRENLSWHDGETLTADDVLFTFQTIQNPQYNSPQFGRFRDVLVEKVDDRTIRFTLPEKFAGFLPYLTLGIIPQHIWGSITPGNSRLAEANIKPIGAGPYQFSKLQKEADGRVVSYTLESFPEYHDQQAYIETIQFRFFPDLTQAIEALQRQTIDGLEFLPQGNRIELSQLKTVTLHSFSLPQYTAAFINQLQNDQLATRAVRAALARAIDTQSIVADVFGDQATVITSPVLPGTPGYDPERSGYTYDIEQARSLLTEAGWERNEETGIFMRDDTPLSVTLTTVDIADTIIVAERIQAAWQELGVETNLQIIPRQLVEQDIIAPRNYEILLFGEVLGADQDQFPFWHSSKRQHPGVNLTAFADTKADSLLEQARTTASSTQRANLYSEFQDILLENIPAIFLYSPTYTYPVHNKVNGITQERINTSADRFNDIANWYIRTERQWAQ